MSLPATIANYTVLAELGRGGMGVVYRARHPEGREVALKLVLDPLEGEHRVRFEREAWACAQLAHPRLVRVLDVGAERGRPFLVLDYVRGASLDERLKREGALEAGLACEIMAEVARGVAHAHAQGILHRDIKPANILIDERGEPVLSDFGLARVAESHLTRTGEILGTPAYMAPEQANGAPVDERADVYGLGATLYALLSGQPPFSGLGTIAILNAVLNEAPTPLREQVPGIDPELASLVERCLAKLPRERPASAAELVDALEAQRTRARAGESGAGLAAALLILLSLLGAAAAGLGLRGRGSEAAPRPSLDASPAGERAGGGLEPADEERLRRARAAWLRGAEEDGLATLEGIASEGPRLACLRAWLRYDAHQLERSEAAAAALLERWPSYAPGHALRAVQLAQRSQAEQSAAALAAARERGLSELDEARVLAWQGHYSRLHRHPEDLSREEVCARFLRLLELEPADQRAEAIRLSHEAALAGGWGSRERELEALVERAPALGLAWLSHTNALRETLAPAVKRGAADALAPVVERGLAGAKRNPRDPLCLANAAIALLSPQAGGGEAWLAERLELSLRHLDRLEEGGARDLEVCRYAADALELAWRVAYQAAIEHLEPDVGPAQVVALCQDAGALARAKRRLDPLERAQLQRAVALLQRSLRHLERFVLGLTQRFPASSPAYGHEIGALYLLGRYEAALQLCRRQVETWPESAYPRERAVSLARHAGKPELARELEEARQRWLRERRQRRR